MRHYRTSGLVLDIYAIPDVLNDIGGRQQSVSYVSKAQCYYHR